MGEPGEKRIFWELKKEFQGQPDRSYPMRSDLKDLIEKTESSTDQKVVAISYDETYTIELLTKKIDSDE